MWSSLRQGLLGTYTLCYVAMPLARHQVRRVAFYVRVSTERQAQVQEGSLKNQQQMLQAELERRNTGEAWGRLVDTYIDGGFSGKSMDRPEFKRLLADVERGAVDAIFFTELSRLSRSLRDFLNIFEYVQQHHCDLVCLKTVIDTTSPFSNLVVKILMVFAEFEREITAERTSRNARERAKRGLANGGLPPLGYKRDPDHKGHLLADDSAQIIRAIFRSYVRLGSAGKTLEEIRRKFRDHHDLKRITRSTFYYILRNRSYLGLREITDEDLTSEVQAAWPAIIDRETFDQAQQILMKGRNQTGNAKSFNYWLSGTLFCAACKQPLSGQSARSASGRIRRYYAHRKSCPEQGLHERIPADDVEALVCQHLQKLNGFRQLDSELLRQIQKQVNKRTGELEKKCNQLEQEARELSGQIEERLSQLRLVTLPEVRRNLENEIAQLQSEHQLLLISQQHTRTAIEGLVAASKQQPHTLLKVCEKNAAQNIQSGEMTRQKIKAFVASIDLKDTELLFRLPLLVAGKPGSLNAETESALVIEDRVSLPGLLLLRSRAVLEHLLDKEKLSRNEIARHLKTSPAAVGTAIYRFGLLGPEGNSGRTRRAPFGFDKYAGKLVKNEAEQKAIMLMKQMQKNGESLRAIAVELNKRKVPTKQGGNWFARTVAIILNRPN
ncbi:MAG: recombinase family protein [Spirochaetales bacterium]|nr:recombinase family protein [Spirochaetales bacterium]